MQKAARLVSAADLAKIQQRRALWQDDLLVRVGLVIDFQGVNRFHKVLFNLLFDFRVGLYPEGEHSVVARVLKLPGKPEGLFRAEVSLLRPPFRLRQINIYKIVAAGKQGIVKSCAPIIIKVHAIFI